MPPVTIRLVSRDEVRLLRLGLARPLYKQEARHPVSKKEGARDPFGTKKEVVKSPF